MKKIFAFALVSIAAAPTFAAPEKPFDIYQDLDSHVTTAACTNSELALLASVVLARRDAAEHDLDARRARVALNAIAAPMNPMIATTWAEEIPSAQLIQDAYLSDRLQYEVTCKMPFLQHAIDKVAARYKEELEKIETAGAVVDKMKSMTGGA